MRILCLTPWFPSHRQDQLGNFILDSVEALAKLGHQVTVLVTQPWRPKTAGLISRNWKQKKILVEQFSNQLNLHSCHYISIPRSFFCSFTHGSYRKRVNPFLKKLLHKFNCQLIHAHTEIAGVSAVDVGKEFGIPTIMTVHGISTESKLYSGKTRQLLFEYPFSNANRVVLVGNSLRNFSQQFVKDDHHFRIVPNGFRSSVHNSVSLEKSWSNENMRFISVSNLQEGKGIDLNLHALSKIKKAGIENWSYKIIGDGDKRKFLEVLVNQLNINQHVRFLGACNHDEVYSQLIQSDVFILPSYREAFGVAYVEAMSCGLLTIGVAGQGPQDFIEHGKTGLLVAPNNIDDLAASIKSLFDSPDKMHEIAATGKKHVHTNFTWHNHAEKLEKIYQELI